MTDPIFSIVLPVYNQAEHIPGVVEGYQRELVRFPARYEMLLVVNGSSDGSAEVCRGLAANDARVRVVETAEKGWGVAVRLGLREARGDVLCYTNSSRTHPNDLLLFLLYAYANQGCIIKANRKVRESLQRRTGSFLYNVLCRTLFDLPYWDINGTPKIFPRTCGPLLALTRNDDLIDLEFHCVCRAEGYPVIEVPIFSYKRLGGRSTTGYGSAFKMYWGAFQLKRERRARRAQRARRGGGL